MSNAIDLSSIGAKLAWAAETTAGTIPATAKRLYGFKSVPELGSQPENLETTTLDALEFKTYIPGLKDLGGALGLEANLTQQLQDAWAAVVVAYETAKAAGLALWFFITIPGLDKAFAFTFQPTALSPGAIEVNAVLVTTVYVTPLNEPAWVTTPTITETP